MKAVILWGLAGLNILLISFVGGIIIGTVAGNHQYNLPFVAPTVNVSPSPEFTHSGEVRK